MNIDKKVLIFDLGGVLLDIYPEKTFKALAELGLSPTFLNEAYCINDSMMQRFERGLLSADEMFSYVEHALSARRHNIHAAELRSRVIDAWCAMLGGINMAKLNKICELRTKGYRVVLLSNTNETHWAAVEAEFAGKGILPSESLFVLKGKLKNRQYYEHTIQARDIIHKRRFTFLYPVPYRWQCKRSLLPVTGGSVTLNDQMGRLSFRYQPQSMEFHCYA